VVWSGLVWAVWSGLGGLHTSRARGVCFLGARTKGARAAAAEGGAGGLGAGAGPGIRRSIGEVDRSCLALPCLALPCLCAVCFFDGIDEVGTGASSESGDVFEESS
jgi:hypothetical protein